MEPGRRSPQLRNSSRSLDLWVPNVATSSGIRIPFCAAYYLCVYRRSELRHKKRKPAGWHFQVVHAAPHGKFVLTDDRSMIDWGAFGAPRRVDCDDLYRQPQTALQHRRISLCVRPAVREEEVAMVR